MTRALEELGTRDVSVTVVASQHHGFAPDFAALQGVTAEGAGFLFQPLEQALAGSTLAALHLAMAHVT